MRLFDPSNRDRSERHNRIYAGFELARTLVDFAAATCFVVGSAFYFTEDLTRQGTWLFLVGSVLFAAKPSLRMAREIKLAALGDTGDLAKRDGG